MNLGHLINEINDLGRKFCSYFGIEHAESNEYYNLTDQLWYKRENPLNNKMFIFKTTDPIFTQPIYIEKQNIIVRDNYVLLKDLSIDEVGNETTILYLLQHKNEVPESYSKL